MVNGAVVGTRNKGDKVAVWAREVVDSDTVGTMVDMMLGRTGVFKVYKVVERMSHLCCLRS